MSVHLFPTARGGINLQLLTEIEARTGGSQRFQPLKRAASESV